MIEYGADVNLIGKSGRSALFEAVWQWHDIIDWLIRNEAKGGNISKSDCFKCMGREFYEIIQLLIENGADIGVPIKSNETVFKLAVRDENEGLIKLLVRHRVEKKNNHKGFFCLDNFN